MLLDLCHFFCHNIFMSVHKRQERWVWEIYLILLLGFVLRKFFNFFYPQSQSYIYFRILYAFDPFFFSSYLFNGIQVTLNLANCIPLILYIYRISWLKPVYWQYLLIFRLIFDIIGHPFELNHIVAAFHNNPKACLFFFIQSISIYLPSYIACFRYAFMHERYITPK